MEYYILSRRGSRELNEDSVGAEEKGNGFCCILADGLGGHDRGEVASALVKDTGLALFDEWAEGGGADPGSFLEACFLEGQNRLLLRQKEAKSEMKTTMVVLAAMNGRIQWGHVGDSRLYQFQNGRVAKRTLDHSVPQLLVMTGEIRERDIRGHEDRNRLLRVMGTEWDKPQFELADPVSVEEGQAYLLCSDGFWELIEEKQMLKTLGRSETVEEWLETMEQEVLKNGCGTNMDNYSAVGVWIGRPKKRKKILGLF